VKLAVAGLFSDPVLDIAVSDFRFEILGAECLSGELLSSEGRWM
jgi:hypothetical protein